MSLKSALSNSTRLGLSLLVGVFLFLTAQCRNKVPAAGRSRPLTQQEIQKQNEDAWLKYWQGTVGVTDPKQLNIIRQDEAAHNSIYHSQMSHINSLRQELKVRTTDGDLNAKQTDSLLAEIARSEADAELAGIQYWRLIDSLLTPVQRKNRLDQLQISPKRLMGRVNAPSGLPEPDTTP